MRAALLVVLALAGRAAADTDPLERIVRDAARTKKPVIVEVGASWCEPCKQFKKDVLADARVKKELGTITFASFEADVGAGFHVASQFDVVEFPTFIVLDLHGVERRRATSADLGSDPITGFLALIDDAKLPLKAEKDVKTKTSSLYEARWLLAKKDPRAEAALKKVIADKHASKADRIEASRLLGRYMSSTRWRLELAERMAATIEIAPDQATFDQLVVAVVDSALPAKRGAALIESVAKTSTDPAIVYIALAAGHEDAALAIATNLVRNERDVNSSIALAEVHRVKGTQLEAFRVLDDAKPTTDQEREAVRTARTRVMNQEEHPELVRTRKRAGAIKSRLAHADQLPSTTPINPAVSQAYQALAKLDMSTGQACAGDAKGARKAFAEIDIAADGVITTKGVFVDTSNPTLQACIKAALDASTIPATGRTKSHVVRVQIP